MTFYLAGIDRITLLILISIIDLIVTLSDG